MDTARRARLNDGTDIIGPAAFFPCTFREVGYGFHVFSEGIAAGRMPRGLLKI
jgi:hypothetical protein